jgi:hypothetical protein
VWGLGTRVNVCTYVGAEHVYALCMGGVSFMEGQDLRLRGCLTVSCGAWVGDQVSLDLSHQIALHICGKSNWQKKTSLCPWWWEGIGQSLHSWGPSVDPGCM